jgi:MYXO-CTERM domain-containing protein
MSSPDAPQPTISTDGAASKDPELIRQEIERTREELAHTVDALHSKLDVVGAAKHRAASVREKVTTSSGKPRPALLAAGGAAVLAVVALVVWRRRR